MRRSQTSQVLALPRDALFRYSVFNTCSRVYVQCHLILLVCAQIVHTTYTSSLASEILTIALQSHEPFLNVKVDKYRHTVETLAKHIHRNFIVPSSENQVPKSEKQVIC